MVTTLGILPQTPASGKKHRFPILNGERDSARILKFHPNILQGKHLKSNPT